MNRPGHESAAVDLADAPPARLALPVSDEQRARFFAHWLQMLCEDIDGVVLALLVHRQDGSNTFATTAFWPPQPADFGPLGEIARHCLTEKRDIVVPAMARTERPGTFVARVGVPFNDDGGMPFSAVALEMIAPTGVRIATDEAVRRIVWAGGWLLAASASANQPAMSVGVDAALGALDLVALCGEHHRPAASALALANELAARFGCTRVSIGFAHSGRVRTAAISHSSEFDARGQFAESLENAMNEAFYQADSVLLPEPSGTSSGIALAHRDLLRRTGSTSVLSAVLRGREGPVGAITMERGATAPFEPADATRLTTLAAILGPVLELQLAQELWLAGKPRRLLDQAHTAVMRPERPMRRVALVSALVLPLLLLLIPGTFRISAKSVLEGRVQRVLVAPFDGYVGESRARAGDVVRAGQMLARMQDRDLALERARWQSEVQTLSAKYADAFARSDRPQVMILGAQVREAQAQLALADEKLAKTQIVAPFDGVVVSGDLSQSLGTPVERGKPLFEVAPLDGFRVVIQVDERDIRFVKAGQSGRIVLSGLPAQALPVTITRTTAVATADEGRNYFRTEGTLAKADRRLRPGMEGVARIDVGSRPLLWIWTRTLGEWLRVFLWKWTP